MEQNPIAMPHTAYRQSARRGLDAGVEFGPGPGGVAPEQSGTVGKPPRRLDQQMRQIGSWDPWAFQRNGSRIDT